MRAFYLFIHQYLDSCNQKANWEGTHTQWLYVENQPVELCAFVRLVFLKVRCFWRREKDAGVDAWNIKHTLVNISPYSCENCHHNTTVNYTIIQHYTNVCYSRLYFCATFAWFCRPVLPYGDLLFIHASTNATRRHKYSPLPSADFDSSGVLVSFSAFVFW